MTIKRKALHFRYTYKNKQQRNVNRTKLMNNGVTDLYPVKNSGEQNMGL